MRQIVLDTETTGLDPRLGHRVIEIAGVEVVNRRLTGQRFHERVNPGREIDAAATEVHGMTLEDLLDKPRFEDVVADFLDFVRGAQLVIHNAPFDIGFLDSELSRLGMEPIESVAAGVLDTLRLAKDLHPGKRNGLDALCERYAVDNARRTLHGALLDAELLAEVYLAMTRGQETLGIDGGAWGRASRPLAPDGVTGRPIRVIVPGPGELAAHATYLEELDRASGGSCLWRRLEAAADAPAS
jgi:DNA polymerase-3 subunit epsilon